MLSRLRVGMFHRDQEEEDNPSNWVPRESLMVRGKQT
jgi:hypothetical protein